MKCTAYLLNAGKTQGGREQEVKIETGTPFTLVDLLLQLFLSIYLRL